MKRWIGIIVSLALLIGLAVGCARTPAENSTSSPEITTASSSGTAAWPRTITDAAWNKVILQQQPHRIALLHSLYLEYFFALGLPPVASMGASTGNAMQVLTEWETLKAYAGTADIIDLGSSRDLNLEAILAVRPDVIVTFKSQGNLDKIYSQLVRIAPVVQVDFSASWQDQTLLCATIVGREAFAQSFITETESIIAAAREKLSQHSGKTVALFRTDGKSFISRGNKEYYDTFGLSRPPGYPDDYQAMSLEAVAAMNPDYIIFQNSAANAQAFVKAQAAFSVWHTLKAVRSGHVFYFDDSLNTFGPLAMRLTAEKLVQVFEK